EKGINKLQNWDGNNVNAIYKVVNYTYSGKALSHIKKHIQGEINEKAKLMRRQN
ncbi:21341_t:CDS:1, partial [Gigaspora rosea]